MLFYIKSLNQTFILIFDLFYYYNKLLSFKIFKLLNIFKKNFNFCFFNKTLVIKILNYNEILIQLNYYQIILLLLLLNYYINIIN